MPRLTIHLDQHPLKVQRKQLASDAHDISVIPELLTTQQDRLATNASLQTKVVEYIVHGRLAETAR
jgi:hypothetical protein